MSYALAATDDLGRLTLSAAYEVDLRLGGHIAPTSVFKKLGIKLREVSGAREPIEAAYLQSDPQTTEILAKAVEESGNETISDVSMLANAMQKIIDQLDGEPDQHQLASIRSFCLALHKALTANCMPQFQEWEESFDYEHSFF